MNILKSNILESKPHIIAITESWTHKDITEAELKIEGYELVGRSDREDTINGRGGGVLLYSNLTNISTVSLQTDFHQILAVKLSNVGEDDLNLQVVYRSPNSSDLNNKNLLNHISNLSQNTIVIGDFNCPEINWNTFTVNAPEDSISQGLLNVSQDKFLEQYVNFPTNFTPQKNETITQTCIDLILTDNPDLVANVKSAGHLAKSKHAIIEAEFMIPTSKNETTELVPDFGKADFEVIRNSLALIRWEEELDELSTERSWELFKDQVYKVMESSIPKKKRRISNRPLWMNQNIMRVIRKKRRLWKWYCTTRDYQDYLSYQKVCASANKVVRKAKRRLERKLAKNIKSNPKSFYKYLNSCTKTRSRVGPLKDTNGILQTDDEVMTGILNTAYSSVFTVEDTSQFPQVEQLYQGDSPLTDTFLGQEVVLKKINTLDPNKTPGPDKFHPKFLKEVGDILSVPLSIIFTKSLREKVVPRDWRTANVVSIFKKGDHTSASNYRPVSLTSIVCKMLESILKDAIMEHLLENELLRSSQHGFMPLRSCLTNLLEFLEEVTKLVDSGHQVDLMYLDFSRAFDKVPHRRLLMKVQSLGVRGNMAAWIEAWLNDRQQRTVLNGKFSEWKDVTSGVPQGSVLGPCLFIIYINDIEAAIDTIMLVIKFADDTKACGVADRLEDCESLQEQVDKLYQWSLDWQMLFNKEKCKVIHIGGNSLRYDYKLGPDSLIKVDSEKDLGVYIHETLCPSIHIAEAVKTANKKLGQLIRTLSYRDRFNFVTLYKSHVRCHLEYCVQAWSPWLKKDIELLEAVQKRAVRCIQGLSGNYEEKLQQIGLPTLVDRRNRGDMIQTFKIVNQIDNVDPNTWFQFQSDTHRPLRGNTEISDDGNVRKKLTLKGRHSNIELRRNFFSNRVIRPWNELPETLRCEKSVNAFKNGYDDLTAIK